MSTIRIKSTHPATQGPFVIISASEFDPQVHQLFDHDDAHLVRDSATGERQPTAEEIENARAELTARHQQLEAEAARQREQAEILQAQRVDQLEQAKALATERAHLAEQAKALEHPPKAVKPAAPAKADGK